MADHRDAAHDGRHCREAELVDQQTADDEPDRRAADAEIDAQAGEIDSVFAGPGDLGEERLIGSGRHGREDAEQFKHHQEKDGGSPFSGLGRHEEQHGKERPKGSPDQDERKAAAETRVGCIAPVADKDVVERAEHPADEHDRPDDAERQQRLVIGIGRRRVKVDEPEIAALAQRFSPDAADGVEQLLAPGERFHR